MSFSPEIADSQDILGDTKFWISTAATGAHGFAVYMALTRNATNGTRRVQAFDQQARRAARNVEGGVFNALGLLVKLNLAKRIHAGDPAIRQSTFWPT